jgi:hypothetical protein
MGIVEPVRLNPLPLLRLWIWSADILEVYFSVFDARESIGQWARISAKVCRAVRITEKRRIII